MLVNTIQEGGGCDLRAPTCLFAEAHPMAGVLCSLTSYLRFDIVEVTRERGTRVLHIRREASMAGVHPREAARIREKLKAELQALITRSASSQRVMREPQDATCGDLVDQTVATSIQEMAVALSNGYRGRLTAILLAFSKLDEGTYGTCELCRVAIDPKRLEAEPAARYCIRCQELRERASSLGRHERGRKPRGCGSPIKRDPRRFQGTARR